MCVSEFMQCLWDQVQEGGREEIQKKLSDFIS